MVSEGSMQASEREREREPWLLSMESLATQEPKDNHMMAARLTSTQGFFQAWNCCSKLLPSLDL